MVNTSVRYIVYNHSGGGVRHHHFSTQNDIIAEADGHAETGDLLPAQGFPFQTYMGQTVPFAFMSVHGAADGNHLYTSPGNQSVTVGKTNIDVLVVYAPPGGIGGPNGGPGVWVDAFNVDVGDFSDDLAFIQILTPPTPPDTVDAAKTTYANTEGVVSTEAAENLRASASVDGGVPFLEWKKIIPVETVDGDRDVDLVQNETGEIWFAFYQTLSHGTAIGRVVEAMAAGIFVWTGDDTCGNGGHWIFPGHGPGPGPAPFKLVIDAKTMRKLNAKQQSTIKAYMKEYPAIAESALEAMTQVLDVLHKAGAILTQAE
jgi:hypothetical protein